MKEPVNTVTVAIDGIGELTNEFRQQAALPETCGVNTSGLSDNDYSSDCNCLGGCGRALACGD
jgi:hypothetical protein